MNFQRIKECSQALEFGLKFSFNSVILCHISYLSNVENDLEKHYRFEETPKPLLLEERSNDDDGLIYEEVYTSRIQVWIEISCGGAYLSWHDFGVLGLPH